MTEDNENKVEEIRDSAEENDSTVEDAQQSGEKVVDPETPDAAADDGVTPATDTTASETTVSQGEQDEESGHKHGKMDWYILKVQVNREDSVKQNLQRRVQLSGLARYFEEILVPTEKVTVVKNGQKRITKRKLYPGYIMIRMEINDDTWFLVRETHGVGDFTGSNGKPVPMLDHEVQRMLQTETNVTSEVPKLKIPYLLGDRVKIVDGTFKDVEGEVTLIDENTGRITVSITIFARSTPVDLEYWQVEKSEE
ncbi:MAG: transcription termination/antitermination protein NusG [Planctomycetia bacterium]|nr:transcription termination/antitermination protein NusG [Planctomycetia bacterium]